MLPQPNAAANGVPFTSADENPDKRSHEESNAGANEAPDANSVCGPYDREPVASTHRKPDTGRTLRSAPPLRQRGLHYGDVLPDDRRHNLHGLLRQHGGAHGVPDREPKPIADREPEPIADVEPVEPVIGRRMQRPYALQD